MLQTYECIEMTLLQIPWIAVIIALLLIDWLIDLLFLTTSFILYVDLKLTYAVWAIFILYPY